MTHSSPAILSTDKEYGSFLAAIKSRVSAARIRATRAVSRELLDLYWEIGRDIVDRQERLGWGKSVVEQLSKDLKQELPGTSGFSAQNLWRMRQFYLEYQDHTNLSQLAREIPWFSNVTIMNKIKDYGAREYYLRSTADLGWSRNVLLHQIAGNAYERHRHIPKQHNFADALPPALAEQADQTMKDVYMLDFLGITKATVEREVERRMVTAIKDSTQLTSKKGYLCKWCAVVQNG